MATKLGGASKKIEFPLSKIDLAIADVIPEMPVHARWPAFNAIRHLNRAWRLRKSDLQMAYFRSITAEEEAATAIFKSLKHLKYRGAEKICHRDHLHKNALFPFMIFVSRAFSKKRALLPPTKVILNHKVTPARMLIEIEVTHRDGTKGYVQPDPPLNFSIKGGPRNSELKLIDFSDEMKEVAKEQNVKNIISHLKERANFRNRLLYASGDGCPDVDGDIEPLLVNFQENVFQMLKLYLLIDPYGQQLFVQQCLDSFLRMLGRFPNAEVLADGNN